MKCIGCNEFVRDKMYTIMGKPLCFYCNCFSLRMGPSLYFVNQFSNFDKLNIFISPNNTSKQLKNPKNS